MRTGRPQKHVDMEKVKKLLIEGSTFREISQSVNVCHTTICRRIRKERTKLGLNSIEEYKSWVRKEIRSKIQEVLIIRTSAYTKYIVVGKKITIRRNKPVSFNPEYLFNAN